LALLAGEGQRGREADGEGDRLGAGAEAVLLVTAAEERAEPGAATDEEGANAGRAVELVGAERQRGGAEGVEVDRKFPRALRGVAMKVRHTSCLPFRGFHALDRPRLVIDEHQRDEPRSWTKQVA